jgi:hypothetical protein
MEDYNYNVMSAADRERQEQAFTTSSGIHPEVEGADVGRRCCPVRCGDGRDRRAALIRSALSASDRSFKGSSSFISKSSLDKG